MRWIMIGGASGVCMCAFVGCTSVPPLRAATGDVKVYEIVQRVKCELADAFVEKLNDPYFRWMASWTIKADLSVLANLQGGVSPTVSYTKIYTNAYNFAAGPSSFPGSTIASVAQNLVTTGSANLSEEAIRTETISFTLSIRELMRWRNDRVIAERDLKNPQAAADNCNPNGHWELAGNLGLAEWINEALEPVARSYLQAGDHPPPGVSKTPPPTGPKEKAGRPAPASLEEARAIAKASAASAKTSADAATASAKAAEASAANAKNTIAPYAAVLEETYKRTWVGFASAVITMANAASRDAAVARAAASNAAKQEALAEKTTDLQTAIDAANAATKAQQKADDAKEDAATQAKDASSNEKIVTNAIPDPPINSLAHSVQFIVAYGASVSPTWTLLLWKGGPVITGNGGRTQTLNLALGPRGKEGAKFSDEQVRQLQLLTIQQSKQQL